MIFNSGKFYKVKSLLYDKRQMDDGGVTIFLQKVKEDIFEVVVFELTFNDENQPTKGGPGAQCSRQTNSTYELCMV